MYSFIARICVVCAVLATAFAEIPSYIKVCNRKDPNLNVCVLNSIEQLRTKLMTGIPELDVPPFDPLILKRIQLVRGTQAAKLDFNITNIQVFGPTTFKIHDLKIDPEKMFITYKLTFDKLDFRGKYQINAKIILLNLIGEGDVTGTFFGYESDCLMKSHKVVRNNKTYVEFEKIKFKIKINRAILNLENLFNGDPVLGPATQELLRTNSDLFINEIKPVLEGALSELFTNVANKITRTFTYDELFPNN